MAKEKNYGLFMIIMEVLELFIPKCQVLSNGIIRWRMKMNIQLCMDLCIQIWLCEISELDDVDFSNSIIVALFCLR